MALQQSKGVLFGFYESYRLNKVLSQRRFRDMHDMQQDMASRLFRAPSYEKASIRLEMVLH